MEKILRLLKIEHVREYVKEKGGEYALDVIPLVLEGGNRVTDEFVAEKLGVKVTIVRSVFNKLHFWGVMDYSKTRDEETGWYTYTWFLLEDKFLEFLLDDLKKKRDELVEKMREYDDVFLFECPNGHERMPFEVAVEYNFKCPHCGADMASVDVEKEKEEIKKALEELDRLEREILDD